MQPNLVWTDEDGVRHTAPLPPAEADLSDFTDDDFADVDGLRVAEHPRSYAERLNDGFSYFQDNERD